MGEGRLSVTCGFCLLIRLPGYPSNRRSGEKDVGVSGGGSISLVNIDSLFISLCDRSITYYHIVWGLIAESCLGIYSPFFAVKPVIP